MGGCGSTHTTWYIKVRGQLCGAGFKDRSQILRLMKSALPSEPSCQPPNLCFSENDDQYNFWKKRRKA